MGATVQIRGTFCPYGCFYSRESWSVHVVAAKLHCQLNGYLCDMLNQKVLGEIHPNSIRLIIKLRCISTTVGGNSFLFSISNLVCIKSKYEYLSWTGYYAKALLAPSSYNTHTSHTGSWQRGKQEQQQDVAWSGPVNFIIISISYRVACAVLYITCVNSINPGKSSRVSGFHLTCKWRCLQELIFRLMLLIFSSDSSTGFKRDPSVEEKVLIYCELHSWVDTTNTYPVDKWWFYRLFYGNSF